MSDFIPVSRPDIGEAEIAEVVDSLRSGWITTGPKVRRFEEELAEYLGAPNVIALSSCTAALHLALLVEGVGPGDEVVVPGITFPSAVNVVMQVGATPVACDVDPETLNLSVEDLARRVGPRTRAIQALHYGGQPCDLDEIRELASHHGAALVEDAAHAMGASYRGRRIGADAHHACFSFYAIKNLTTGEGGCLALRDTEQAKRARVLSLHGMSRDAWKRYGRSGSWRYDIEAPGYKYNMTDLQAALGLHQLERIDAMNARRRAISSYYAESFADNPAIRGLARRTDRESSDHLHVVRVDPEASSLRRDELVEALRDEGIGTTVHFIPLHRFTAYRGLFRAEDLPSCEAVADELLSLPLFPSMTDSEAERVVEAVQRLTRS